MDVSVAICTRNRQSLLQMTLRRMTKLKCDSNVTWELIVVDNGSSDGTRLVVDGFRGQLPVRYIYEDRPGHTIARNRAIVCAEGDVILWTDDDVLVCDEWINRYVTAFDQWPDASFFGGNVEPLFEVPPPEWLSTIWKDVAGYYAARSFADEEFRCDNDRIPFGANFAIRMDVQRQHLFDERLGRRGRNLAAGDETTLLRSLLGDGHIGRWVPGASVQHFIPKERLVARYLWGNFFHHGARSVLLNTDSAVRPSLRKIGQKLLSSARHGAVCCLTNRRRSPELWLSRFRSASMNLGEASMMFQSLVRKMNPWPNSH